MEVRGVNGWSEAMTINEMQTVFFNLHSMTPATPKQAGSRPCSLQRRNDVILHPSDIQMCTFAVRLLADDLRSKQQSLWGSHQRDPLWGLRK